jgi:hypothetical protein
MDKPAGDGKRHLYFNLACCALLFGLNLFLALPLLKVEYLADMHSIDGVFIGLARWIRMHPGDLRWFPFWYGGMPFQDVYPPAFHMVVALSSWIGDVSVARAYHGVEAVTYSLGSVTMFLLMIQMGASRWLAFGGALFYSLFSPSAWLISPIRVDLGGPWFLQRFHTLIAYGNGPHVASLTFLPLTWICLDMALEKTTARRVGLAVLALVVVPLTNWPGTVVLAAAMLVYVAAYLDSDRFRSRTRYFALFGMVCFAYLVVVRWLPPSTVSLTLRNTQALAPDYRFQSHHLYMWGTIALIEGFTALALSRCGAPRLLRLGILFFIPFSSIVLGNYWTGVTLIAQPQRFHLAMEMAIVMMLVALGEIVYRARRGFRIAFVAVILPVFAVQGFVAFRYTRKTTKPIDITRTSEYKIADWMQDHSTGRVMVPGSVTFWLNAFTDTPQLAGCCDQSYIDIFTRYAQYAFQSDENAGDRAGEVSIAWLQAFGVQEVAVCGPGSTEAYHAMRHPGKFVGLLEERWRDDTDDFIYEIPQRTKSLAHAVYRSELVARAPVHGLDIAPLAPYIKAIEDPGRSDVLIRWTEQSRIRLEGSTSGSEVISLQIPYVRGWEAYAEGRRLRIGRDQLGLMFIEPMHPGPNVIDLRFTGGAEMQVASILSTIATLAIGLALVYPAKRS